MKTRVGCGKDLRSEDKGNRVDEEEAFQNLEDECLDGPCDTIRS